MAPLPETSESAAGRRLQSLRGLLRIYAGSFRDLVPIVAVGVAVGAALGAYRIVSGTPLQYYIIIGCLVVVIQTWKTTKAVVPLAYDSGGATTSAVTVPVVAALGLGLASTIPGRSPLIDGFGLIAFASLLPIMSVMDYAMLTDWWRRRSAARSSETETMRLKLIVVMVDEEKTQDVIDAAREPVGIVTLRDMVLRYGAD